MSAGVLKMPVVLRISIGSKYGAQHSQDWTSMIAHVPGLKCVFPATPYDAKGLMNSALNGSDPVVFFESQRIYDVGELFHEGGVPEGYYEVEIGEPDVAQEATLRYCQSARLFTARLTRRAYLRRITVFPPRLSTRGLLYRLIMIR